MLARKCQFGGHVEILLASYCELDWDVPVSRNKATKTNTWMRIGLLTTLTSVLRILLIIRETSSQARPPGHHVMRWELSSGLVP